MDKEVEEGSQEESKALGRLKNRSSKRVSLWRAGPGSRGRGLVRRGRGRESEAELDAHLHRTRGLLAA